ncbi:hypothetical protein H9N28_08115 [Rhodobacter capsulatus]|uniref:hypothetical protein n=1 Tax=Rhodobacter capsulatus TaxID=1061 RepID=UPI000A4C28AB|nr:hypothetical protein [Rhodobacter capsulatus]PZX21328.1 hypothetical protein LY44_03447 [Rhodobacter capsulatus]QNR64761.1 hypothetical protein H9N28_08115 [Rhodobacter capsulatus]
MSAEIYTMPPLPTATCSGCGATFAPPVLPSRAGGNATTCRACAAAAIEAEHAAERSAYTAMSTTGTTLK